MVKLYNIRVSLQYIYIYIYIHTYTHKFVLYHTTLCNTIQYYDTPTLISGGDARGGRRRRLSSHRAEEAQKQKTKQTDSKVMKYSYELKIYNSNI